MTEEVKPEVIKQTQDGLGKYVKKPPLTEKLLKKPPFRFLHDIITSIIKDHGFLEGLFTPEELNHENIKDRDGKILFLDKLISAVKLITGVPLSVRSTKIVAGHEATKTNELLQAIGSALDKKLDSKDVVQQLRKKGGKKSSTADIKNASPRESKKVKEETSKTRPTRKQDENKEQHRVLNDPKKRSSSNSKTPKEKDTLKQGTSKSKKDGSRTKEPKRSMSIEEPPDLSSTRPEEAPAVQPNERAERTLEVSGQDDIEPMRPQSAVGRRRQSVVPQPSETENKSDNGQSSDHNTEQKTSSTKVLIPPASKDIPAITPTDVPPQNETAGASNSDMPVIPNLQQNSKTPDANTSAPAPVPLVRPRTAARIGSARPGAPRVRNRGEAVVVSEELAKPATVNLIVEGDSTKNDHEDGDENLVVVETAPSEETDVLPDKRPVSGASRPSSQQGHLVAQILETQKELEVSNASKIENGDLNPHHVEIEWEGGRKRERESASKEVERLRSLIQTLTRAAHPLGKLLDSLQEDVDNMQRELAQWGNMQSSLEQQLRIEEKQCEQATQPLKEQLKQLQQSVKSQLDQISVTKANILANDERIRVLLTGGHD